MRLQQALQGRERSSEPPSSPAAQQELAAAEARADKAEAVSSQHLQEIAALNGQCTSHYPQAAQHALQSSVLPEDCCVLGQYPLCCVLSCVLCLHFVSASCACVGVCILSHCVHAGSVVTQSVTAGRLQQIEQEAGRWRTTAMQAQAAAAKLEADIEGLGNAYNMIEAHSHDLESRIQELESIGERHASHSA